MRRLNSTIPSARREITRKLRILGVTLMVLICGIAPGYAKEALRLDAQTAGTADTRPNIVFILTDDVDTKLLQYMPKTKQLIADEGALFENYIFGTSLCCPSRATLLTGKYTHNTGVYDNDGTGNGTMTGGYRAFYNRGNESSTIGTWLQDSGYNTGFYGKYLNGYPRTAGLPQNHVPAGWTDWVGNLVKVYDQYNYMVNDNGTVRSDNEYMVDMLSDRAQDFMQQSADEAKPFLVYMSPTSTHAPFVPAERHQDTFPGLTYPKDLNFNERIIKDKPQYVRELPMIQADQIAGIDENYRKRAQAALALDEMVEDLVNKVDELGQLDNTMFVFSSDNGFHMGEHRIGGAPGYPNLDLTTRGGKNTPYEEDIRVPMYIRGPGITGGQVFNQLVSNIDMAPTIAEVAGVPIPDFVDGRSLLPLISGQYDNWRSSVLLRRGNSVRYVGLRTKDMTYIKYRSGEIELYDLVNDPFQMQNIADTAPPWLLRQFDRRTQEMLDCSGLTCRKLEDLPIPTL